MRLRSLIAAVAFSAIFASTSAEAVVVDFSGSNVNMGNLAYGQAGTITDITTQIPGNLYQSIVTGNLPRMTRVTFTYNFPAYFLIGDLKGAISYDFMQSGIHHNGFSNAESKTDVFFNTTNTLSQQGYLNSIAGVSQVFATALLTTPGDGTATGKITIANYTQYFQNFTDTFIGAFSSLCNGNPPGVITYKVDSIPLPAALPMMLSALGGLFGFGRVRQRQYATA